MKIALCLHGLVGSIKGKNHQLMGGSDIVLQKSFEHNKKYLLDKWDVDVFVHSWSTELKDEIEELYKPKRSLIEEQIQFKIPDYIKSNENRIFAHLSRWYSYWKVVDLVYEYADKQQPNPFSYYDHVLVQRFDLCWNVTPAFNEMNDNYLWVGKSGLNTDQEWSDRWFSSNLENMEKLSILTEKWEEYMGKGGSFPSSKQYGGLSSHFLVKHHAEQMGLEPKFKYMFGGHGRKPNDYSEVRRQYYGDR